MTNQRPLRNDRYVIVVSETGRKSCWQVGRPVPAGWQASGPARSRQACLDEIARTESDGLEAGDDRGLRLSLMFFGDSGHASHGDKYRLLFEASRFADRNGFEGVWLPERHFTDFGSLFPCPAVLHASLARETQRLRLRAGSVVLPLNDPLRVAEQWSLVDNLSGGRAEVAFASGWHPDDFVLMPDVYDERVEAMHSSIAEVRALWDGRSIRRVNGAGDPIDVKTFPAPLQSELPIWLTAAGNPETFRRAGEMGCGVLTHLFHQDVGELKGKLEVYREALRAAGYSLSDARVAVTLHTFLDETIDEVKAKAGNAYCAYLRKNLGLLKQLAFSQGHAMDIESLPESELNEMLQWLFDKFAGGRSLMGTPESCFDTCRELAEIGVTEIACLLDFGPAEDDVLTQLPLLAALGRSIAELRVH